MSQRNVEKCILRPINGNGMMQDVPLLFIMFAKLKVGQRKSHYLLTFETSGLEFLNGGQFTLSTQSINSNSCVVIHKAFCLGS